MKLWKYSGTFLTVTGIIHTIYALFIGKDAFSEMLRNGLVNSVGENYNLGFAFWFLIVSHRSTPSAKHLHYRDAIVFRSSQ